MTNSYTHQAYWRTMNNYGVFRIFQTMRMRCSVWRGWLGKPSRARTARRGWRASWAEPSAPWSLARNHWGTVNCRCLQPQWVPRLRPTLGTVIDRITQIQLQRCLQGSTVLCPPQKLFRMAPLPPSSNSFNQVRIIQEYRSYRDLTGGLGSLRH